MAYIWVGFGQNTGVTYVSVFRQKACGLNTVVKKMVCMVWLIYDFWKNVKTVA